MGRLVMLRHGKSEWNKRNLFTGWVDIPLSVEGVQEALQAGRKIADIPFDAIFSSGLIRAKMTALLAMSEHRGGRIPYIVPDPNNGERANWGKIYSSHVEDSCIPVICAWQLNERMYGELQGLDKQETAEKFGEKQVQLWRRSYDIAPPGGESLEMTASRAIPYFKERILPFLEKGQNVLITAHGNSLRAIVMFLEDLSKEKVLALEIATGEPMIYHFAEGCWSRGSFNE